MSRRAFPRPALSRTKSSMKVTSCSVIPLSGILTRCMSFIFLPRLLLLQKRVWYACPLKHVIFYKVLQGERVPRSDIAWSEESETFFAASRPVHHLDIPKGMDDIRKPSLFCKTKFLCGAYDTYTRVDGRSHSKAKPISPSQRTLTLGWGRVHGPCWMYGKNSLLCTRDSKNKGQRTVTCHPGFSYYHTRMR